MKKNLNKEFCSDGRRWSVEPQSFISDNKNFKYQTLKFPCRLSILPVFDDAPVVKKTC